MTPTDVTELLSLGAGPVVECPDRTLSELFEEQVGRTPGAVAVVAGDESLTYAELNARANKLARRLGAVAPVGRDRVVAVCLPRSELAVIGVLAVLKAGSAYLPLDPDYPAARLTHMLEESRAVALITHTDAAPALVVDAPAPPMLLLDRQQGLVDGSPAGDLGSVATSGDLAYVIYTSGSTGRPKGVMIEHRNIVNYLAAASGVTRPGPDDRVAQIVSPSFDPALREILGPLLVGARILMLPEPADRSPRALAELFASGEVTVAAAIVPSLLRQLIEHAEAKGLHWPLRVLATAGETLTTDLTERLRPIMPTGLVVNQYGPAESTMVSCRHIVRANSADAATIPVGRPVANARLVLMSEDDQLVARGAVGEIWIGGAGVGRGYLGQPGLTAERFVTVPYRGYTERFYRTGDLGRWLPDGSLEFVGRVDHQIKLRGHRIEPGEIEACLRSHPDVVDALVTADQDGHGAQRLIAYLRGDWSPVEELRQHLARYVPAYMVPTHFVTLDDFPLTANGKIDRARLPEPEETRPEIQTGYLPPRDPTEAAIAEIWEDILGLDRIGVHDNFLHLGGHSLLATSILNRIHQEIGASLDLGEFLSGATIAATAQLVAEGDVPSSPRKASNDPAVGAHGKGILSFAQERLWFLSAMEAGNPFYNMLTAVSLTGGLDHSKLRQALCDVIEANEILRTVFTEDDGALRSSVRPLQDVEVSLVSVPDGTDADTWIERVLTADLRTPFSLADGPLLRFKLLELSSDRHILATTYHHIVMDWWSEDLFNEQIAEAYAARLRGEEYSGPPNAVQYADFARWERSREQVLSLENLPYWLDELADAEPVVALPTDRERPAAQTHAGDVVRLPVPTAVIHRARALARDQEATFFVAALAAFSVLISKHTGQQDLIIGTPSAGRPQTRFENTLGFFSNTLPIRIRNLGDQTFEELIGQVRSQVIGGYSHEHFLCSGWSRS
ncbi:amino acid adenylation domain-containing protein [Actinomadura rupiterrae]|nr:amino acid adenylation domain-containing protein [Actinomadura rupiterrae]MCP2340679.1 amino acid adenylation domain-containing protein [Actinomadura rupiterrae]